ncbi:hypothetical protein R6H00_07955, partial [Actinotignum timonense]|nr:hypothetical protein [Actinotignum timonense]
ARWRTCAASVREESKVSWASFSAAEAAEAGQADDQGAGAGKSSVTDAPSAGEAQAGEQAGDHSPAAVESDAAGGDTEEATNNQ